MPRSGGPYGPARLRVLFADPDRTATRNVAAALAAELINCEIETVETLIAAETRMIAQPCDAVVASLDLGPGLHMIDRLRPLIAGPLIVSARTHALAREARRHGADDAIIAPYNSETVIRRLSRFGDAMAVAAGVLDLRPGTRRPAIAAAE